MSNVIYYTKAEYQYIKALLRVPCISQLPLAIVQRSKITIYGVLKVDLNLFCQLNLTGIFPGSSEQASGWVVNVTKLAIRSTL